MVRTPCASAARLRRAALRAKIAYSEARAMSDPIEWTARPVSRTTRCTGCASEPRARFPGRKGLSWERMEGT